MTIRKALFFSILLSLFAATPAVSQTVEKVEGRVKKLESEMRAVQRKVFPGASKEYFEPEITAPASTAETPGVPASNPLNDLTQRVDSLERQLVTMTGQIEENGFKLRQLEAQLQKFKTDAEFRLTTLEGGTLPGQGETGAPVSALTPAAPSQEPAQTATTKQPAMTTPAAPALDPIEGEYRAAYGHVTAKDWANAEASLKAFVEKHPAHARASNAQYWLGRTYFAEGQPVQAARALLENYQKRPEGERSQESLLWLGKSLMAFTPPSPTKACEAYEQLETSYGKRLSQSLRTQLTEARSAARCG